MCPNCKSWTVPFGLFSILHFPNLSALLPYMESCAVAVYTFNVTSILGYIDKYHAAIARLYSQE